jgi:crotonobetainyl-CoA:carnitine CoA-transferase CaiB-like acyl-CoA transferase
MSGPLAGIKILDAGAFTVGPAACSLLGLMGAEAIRIEPPNLDGLLFVGTIAGGIGTSYISSHYNKKSIMVDLRSPLGKEIGIKLVKWADVLVNNRRLGALDRIGFGYKDIIKINPRIVYIESTSYGTTGPWSQYAAGDHFVQAASGFASINGKEGGEAEILRYATHADYTASLIILNAAIAGLIAREKTGKGQRINTSHLQGTIAVQTSRLSEFFVSGKNPALMGSVSSRVAPSQAFRTQDNKYINISADREEYWVKICKALELDALMEDPRFSTNDKRLKNRKELIPLIQEKVGDKPAYWWMLHFDRCDVPYGFNYDYVDLIRDPHVNENKWLYDMDSSYGILKGYAAPWEFSKTPAEEMTPTVKFDKDRDEILEMLEKY